MKTLGIDYGRSKVGIAIGIDTFAEPLKVIKYKDIKTLSEVIKKIVEEEKIKKVIVGISEGTMAEEIKIFVSTIAKHLMPIACETYDETLTSSDAQKMSIAAGVPQKRRHDMEDAYAASIMLQNYLDSF